eukprot:365315-Chlamydomonas_euryale.AAC.6
MVPTAACALRVVPAAATPAAAANPIVRRPHTCADGGHYTFVDAANPIARRPHTCTDGGHHAFVDAVDRRRLWRAWWVACMHGACMLVWAAWTVSNVPWAMFQDSGQPEYMYGCPNLQYPAAGRAPHTTSHCMRHKASF